MAGRYIATIDCGSSNVRCIIFDMDTGRQVSVAARDWYVPQSGVIPGAYDFDAKVNWPLVCECTQKALSRVDPYYLLDRMTLDVPAGSYGMQVLFSDIANQQHLVPDPKRCDGQAGGHAPGKGGHRHRRCHLRCGRRRPIPRHGGGRSRPGGY